LTTLLLIDDHPLFCDGFEAMARTLRGDWTILVSHSAASALERLSPRALVDLVLIDISLPDSDGFALAAEIGQRWPSLPRALISGREDIAARVRARSAGASGFIAKAARPETIVEMVQAVLDGGEAFDLPSGAKAPRLTPRQARLLELLGEGHGNKEICHRLNLAERTVRAHLTDLFQLLGAHNRAQAVLRARELGLIG
jgi:DNA-binding NarL/FixJ family response regulator